MLKHLLQASLLGLVLSGCTFHRVQSNSALRDIDPTRVTVGESTWRDVLREFGTPSASSTENIRAGLASMVTFRYACADQKSFNLLFAYLLYLPFKWGDKQAGYELIVEFDKGIVSDLYTVNQKAVWRPFQSPVEREVTFYRGQEVAP